MSHPINILQNEVQHSTFYEKPKKITQSIQMLKCIQLDTRSSVILENIPDASTHWIHANKTVI